MRPFKKSDTVSASVCGGQRLDDLTKTGQDATPMNCAAQWPHATEKEYRPASQLTAWQTFYYLL